MFHYIISTLLVGSTLLRYILFFISITAHSNMKFGNFSWNSSVINIICLFFCTFLFFCNPNAYGKLLGHSFAIVRFFKSCFYLYNLYIVNAVSKHVYTILIEKKKEKSVGNFSWPGVVKKNFDFCFALFSVVHYYVYVRCCIYDFA